MNQGLREGRNRRVVTVRFVSFEHRELGTVRRVGALVSEVAVDLEDALNPTHDRTLQVELGSNAQKELHVERIRMGDKRPSGCATVHHLQHGCLDLEKVPAAKRCPQRGHHGGTRHHGGACLLAHNQVEVATAHAALFAEFVVQVWQGQ